MGIHAIKLPDVGEGVAEAELVEWHVAVGDLVKQDDVIAAVMTDKATVEIPSAVTGTIVWLGGEVGEKLAVGSELVRLVAAVEHLPRLLPIGGLTHFVARLRIQDANQ